MIDQIDRATAEWTPLRAACHVALFSRQSLVGAIQMRLDEKIGENVWRTKLAELAERGDIAFPVLQAALPEATDLVWDDSAIVGLGAIEIQGRSDGLLIWLLAPNPAGLAHPTPEENAAAHQRLNEIKTCIWPT
jgi:hypothetical protein